MDLPAELRSGIRRFRELGRWERAELGRSLRRLGLSYGEIQRLIPVPKGTLAGWCRDIHLTPRQIAALQERCGPGAGPRDTQWKRRQEIERIRAEAADYATAHIVDPFWVAGTVLYWGEGSKTKRTLAVANSDAAMLRLFKQWCHSYHTASARFVLSMHLHDSNNEDAARSFWSEQLGVSDFTRTFIKPGGTGHRTNRLAYGVCRLRMRRSTDAWIRTMQWIETLSSQQSVLANLPTGR